MNFIKNFSRGCGAMKMGWSRTSEPSPVGSLIYANQNIPKNIHPMGWHAGPYSLLEKQITQGYFDSVGRDIYFAPLKEVRTAAHFGAKDQGEKPVLLSLGVEEEIPDICINEQFHTLYFPATSTQRVYILSAYKVCGTWCDYMQNPKNQLSYAHRLNTALEEGVKAFKQDA